LGPCRDADAPRDAFEVFAKRHQPRTSMRFAAEQEDTLRTEAEMAAKHVAAEKKKTKAKVQPLQAREKLAQDLLAARKAQHINDFEPRQGHLLKWPKGQLITSLVPSFDAPDVQLKTGEPLQGRVVGRVQTNCCLMVTFDREIAAATDTVKTGMLPLRDGAMPGLDKGKKVGAPPPLHIHCISAASHMDLASISPGVRAPRRAYAEEAGAAGRLRHPRRGNCAHAACRSRALHRAAQAGGCAERAEKGGTAADGDGRGP
jgi:hypothetical protein